MNILLLGSGGREHALAASFIASKHCTKLFVAPGNGGTAEIAENVALDPCDFAALAAFAKAQDIAMIYPGPEAPLVAGIRDYFASHSELQHIQVIGPDKRSAMLEGSKAYAKAFMQRHGIPTAAYQEFTSQQLDEAKAYIGHNQPPFVLKADGLAAGKGVVITSSRSEAEQELTEMLGGKFGAASTTVVIEEFMDGIELSVFALTDGKSYKLLPTAKDYKRILENDQGPNTGGMGAVCPLPFADEAFMQKVEERIVQPTISGLRKDGMDYKGVVYFGLMKVGDDPKVVEYNCRFGDPEAEVLLPMIESDWVEVCQHMWNDTLDQLQLQTKPGAAATIVLVSKGYPGSYSKGKSISIQSSPPSAFIFHAGTQLSDNQLLTSGGRVFAVTGFGESLSKALSNAYAATDGVTFDGCTKRQDIGQDVLTLASAESEKS